MTPIREVHPFECKRCGHKWYSRCWWVVNAPLPAKCPKCTSPYWDKPRKNKKASKP